jgi:hypothetical protein
MILKSTEILETNWKIMELWTRGHEYDSRNDRCVMMGDTKLRDTEPRFSRLHTGKLPDHLT